jgi:Flp pilus assembly pilin Flp
MAATSGDYGGSAMRRLVTCLPADGGATAIEYALIAGLISIVIIAACTSIGQMISALFLGPIANALQ